MKLREAKLAGYTESVWIAPDGERWYYYPQKPKDLECRKGLLHPDGRAVVQMNDGDYFPLPVNPSRRPVDLVQLVLDRMAELEWTMSELDRRAGLSIGESRRFLTRERAMTHPKVECILAALELTVTPL